MTDIRIRAIGAQEAAQPGEQMAAQLTTQLSDLLLDCVEGGASVGFMLPLARARADAFWRGVADGVARGERTLIVAEDAQGIAGTVQLITAMPDNQPHRADVAKLLVRRRARGAGIGRRLMEAVDAAARAQGRHLLVLDTADATAARLYERLGWRRAGSVPDFALLPQGGLCATTFYYKQLTGAA
jgi:GNAT superfamily N-acetyltransferase